MKHGLKYGWLLGLVLIFVGGCRCHTIERFNETYARGKFVRCPEGVWVYNHDLISGERQRYLITNEELIGYEKDAP